MVRDRQIANKRLMNRNSIKQFLSNLRLSDFSDLLLIDRDPQMRNYLGLSYVAFEDPHEVD
jgi:hypothetical protein